jgi:hypothetical protein
MKFNQGKFIGNKYVKQVEFSRAVLWKDKQISLNITITNQFKEKGVELVIFEDARKNERWTAIIDALRETKVLKTEGQEKQWYFPINIFKVTQIKRNKSLLNALKVVKRIEPDIKQSKLL